MLECILQNKGVFIVSTKDKAKYRSRDVGLRVILIFSQKWV
jgi:hypothetical protein